MEVLNHDMVGLYNRLNRFCVEMHKSVSSSQADEFIEFDVTRLRTYLFAIKEYQKWMVAQPQLDLPETAPRKYTLDDPPVLDVVENESCNDVLRMLVICRDELTNSQSGRRPAGLNTFDDARLTAICLKVENFIDMYIEKATPIDLPESAPQRGISGPGRGGIEPN